ncbi:MAG: heparan-alpha-glucosaminide N-acetyltransferase domain-containing protein [Sandaracinaceae bacterium]
MRRQHRRQQAESAFEPAARRAAPTSESARVASTRRDPSLDALRAIAVVAMVVWHITDGWLAEEHRAGPGWHTVRVFGGLAAPLFLVVSGVAVARAREAGRRILQLVFRGVGVLAFGGLLRIQNWLVDAGGVMEWRSVAPALLGSLGYAALIVADQRQDRRWWGVATVMLLGFAWRVGVDVPDHAARVLAVDVLSCIGAAVILTAWLSRLPSAVVLASGLAVVGASTMLPQAVDDAWLAGWIGTPHPESPRYALFPLFPWVGYAFVGYGLAGTLRAHPWKWCIGGALLASLCFEGGLPAARRLLHDLPVLRPFMRFGFHLGAVLALGGVAATLKERDALLALGRVSLPVYWMHLQIAYGLLSLPYSHDSQPLVCFIGATSILLAATLAATHGKGVLRLPTSWNRARASAANSRA